MLYNILDTETKRAKEKKKNKKFRKKIKFKSESIRNVRKRWNSYILKKEQEKVMNIKMPIEETVDKSNKQIDKRAKIIARTEAKLYYLETGRKIRNKYKNSRALQLKERMYSCLSYNKEYVYQIAPEDYVKIFHDDYMEAYNNIYEKKEKGASDIKEKDIKETVDSIFNKEENKEGGNNMSNNEEKFNGHNVTGNGSRAIKNKFSDEDGMYSMSKGDIDNPASWVTPIDKGEKIEVNSKSMWNDDSHYERDMPEIPVDRPIYTDMNNTGEYDTNEYRDAIEKLRQLRDEVSQEEQGLVDDQQAASDSYNKYQKTLNRIEDECRERAEKLKTVRNQRQEAQKTKKMIDQRTEEMMKQMQVGTDFTKVPNRRR